MCWSISWATGTWRTGRDLTEEYPRIEREVETPAQLRRGLPSEGDRRHVLDLIHTGSDAGRHALGQHLRLARSGAGLDEDVGEQPAANRRTGLCVD